MLSYEGFLHDHPGLQAKLGLDAEHIIVDKSDWVSVRQNTKESPENVSQQLKAEIRSVVERLSIAAFENDTVEAEECINRLRELSAV